MSQRIFLIRHCQAKGQEPTAPLTEQGQHDAIMLAEFLNGQQIEAIYSSPYVRAVQTATPLAEALGLSIHTDERLKERVLSSQNLPDWMNCLKLTFEDLTVKYYGGESSQEAMERAIQAVQDILASQDHSMAVVTHGNLMSMILHYFDRSYGFEAWKNLTNPDVFLLNFENGQVKIGRFWT